jgi:hypothetical protein
MNDMLDAARKRPITLEDCVTDERRDKVIDLKAAGFSDEAVAKFLRISKERCQRLFEWELESGRQLRTAQVTRALLFNAIQLGDTRAQIGYLKNQPQEDWGTKHEVKDRDDTPKVLTEVQLANEAFIADIIAGLSTDPK